MTQPKYMTLRQFTNKYTFVTLEGLRWQVYKNENFKDACARKFGGMVLLDENKVLEFIEKSKWTGTKGK